MAVSANEVRKRWAWITGLRGALMILAGLYAVFAPGAALTVLVIAGGALILVDGVLGLWSLAFGGGKSGNYWFDVIRNVLSIVLGVLILISPVIATFITAIWIVYLFAFQAIIVGVMEIVVIIRERESYARIWPVLLSGALYVIFGVALLFAPMIGALTMVIFGGILAILFGIALIGFALKLHQKSKASPAG